MTGPDTRSSPSTARRTAWEAALDGRRRIDDFFAKHLEG